jgi:hypothetical protein
LFKIISIPALPCNAVSSVKRALNNIANPYPDNSLAGDVVNLVTTFGSSRSTHSTYALNPLK